MGLKTLASIAILLVISGYVGAAERPLRWVVFYGRNFPMRHLGSLDIAILDPDNIRADALRPKAKPGAKFLGYLSVGEVNEARGYWPEVKGKDFLVEENPDWKGAHRVDIRSKLWQRELTEKVIPQILAKGYDGLFLDTIDTAGYLEGKDPEKFRGSREEMARFVGSLHKAFPQAMIIPNNGLDILESIAPEVDGVLVEDLYTRYDFEKKVSQKTPAEVTAAKETILDRFHKETGKPVLNLLYAPSLDSPLAKEGIRRSRGKGYQWYVTTVDLMTVGHIAR